MAQKGVGNTALGAAVCRLIEQYQPEKTRLFNDPVVKGLVGAPIRVMMQIATMRNFTIRQTDAVARGVFGVQICRTRAIDDAVQAALSGGIRQLVILGAGYDTRAYRLTGLENVPIFEVDLPSVQADKKQKLQKSLGRLPDNVTFIPIDFDTQSLESVLSGTGPGSATTMDLSQPVVFIWEGVTQYLPEDSVSQVLAFVGKCSPGSILIFTYVLKSVIEGRSGIPGADKMMDRVAKGAAPWVFGMEPAGLQAYLQPFHLTLLSDVGSADYQKTYLGSLNRDMAVSEIERVAQAVVIRP